MYSHPQASSSSTCRCLRALACLSLLGLGASPAGALPPLDVDDTPGVLLAQGGPLEPEQGPQEGGQASFADLEKLLEATRAKLEELNEAADLVASGARLREEVAALRQDKQRLERELAEVRSREAELRSASDTAKARLAELGEAVEEARRESAGRDEEIARLRRQIAQLNESLVRADAARKAAVADAQNTRIEMAAELQAATDAAKQSASELAELREELDEARRELASARSAGEQAGTRVSELEEAVQRSTAEAGRLRTELAALKEQVGQAAGAAVEAERARRAASDEAEALRREAADARDRLSAAGSEIERLESANAELEKEVAVWRTSSTSAIETARQNLVMMEKKIAELNAALAVAPPEEAMPARSPPTRSNTPEQATPAGTPQTKPTAPQPERPGPTDAPAIAQSGAPEPAREPRSGQPADSPLELSETQLSMVDPTAASEEADSRLADFRSKIQALNDMELSTEGIEVFSGIASVEGRTVHVGATAAWDALPAAGKQSYLDSLLDYWVAAQGEQGPAVVRIVDPSNRVLVEKAWP